MATALFDPGLFADGLFAEGLFQESQESEDSDPVDLELGYPLNLNMARGCDEDPRL